MLPARMGANPICARAAPCTHTLLCKFVFHIVWVSRRRIEPYFFCTGAFLDMSKQTLSRAVEDLLEHSRSH